MTYISTFFQTDITSVESCSGHLIKLRNGELLRDLTGGITSHSILGWANEEVIETVTKQLKAYSHLDYKTFHDPLRDTLGSLLLGGVPQWAKGSDWSVFYPGLSGSDAVESAVKLAYQLHHCRGQPERTEILSFRESYHGSTLGSLSLGDRPNLAIYSNLFPRNVHRLNEINSFRPPDGVSSDSDLLLYGLADFNAALANIGAERVCCVVGETIAGGLTGYVSRPAGYWEAIKEICQTHGIILILDEIICGSGATGTYYCWEQDSVAPDITVFGKTLAGGFLPCNALLVANWIFEEIKASAGRIQQSNTFQGHSLAMAVAGHIQKQILTGNFLSQVREKGVAARKLITHRLRHSARFLDCTGRGMRYSIQLAGANSDQFARLVTQRCEKDAKILVDGKWHRFTFSPQLDINLGELLHLTSLFCDIFLDVEHSNLPTLDGDKRNRDPQRRY